jgi:hypothetical protein
MGHIVNPILFRLGHSRVWVSSWNTFNLKDFKFIYDEDYKIHSYLNWFFTIFLKKRFLKNSNLNLLKIRFRFRQYRKKLKLYFLKNKVLTFLLLFRVFHYKKLLKSHFFFKYLFLGSLFIKLNRKSIYKDKLELKKIYIYKFLKKNIRFFSSYTKKNFLFFLKFIRVIFFNFFELKQIFRKKKLSNLKLKRFSLFLKHKFYFFSKIKNFLKLTKIKKKGFRKFFLKIYKYLRLICSFKFFKKLKKFLKKTFLKGFFSVIEIKRGFNNLMVNSLFQLINNNSFCLNQIFSVEFLLNEQNNFLINYFVRLNKNIFEQNFLFFKKIKIFYSFLFLDFLINKNKKMKISNKKKRKNFIIDSVIGESSLIDNNISRDKNFEKGLNQKRKEIFKTSIKLFNAKGLIKNRILNIKVFFNKREFFRLLISVLKNKGSKISFHVLKLLYIRLKKKLKFFLNKFKKIKLIQKKLTKKFKNSFSFKKIVKKSKIFYFFLKRKRIFEKRIKKLKFLIKGIFFFFIKQTDVIFKKKVKTFFNSSSIPNINFFLLKKINKKFSIIVNQKMSLFFKKFILNNGFFIYFFKDFSNYLLDFRNFLFFIFKIKNKKFLNYESSIFKKIIMNRKNKLKIYFDKYSIFRQGGLIYISSFLKINTKRLLNSTFYNVFSLKNSLRSFLEKKTYFYMKIKYYKNFNINKNQFFIIFDFIFLLKFFDKILVNQELILKEKGLSLEKYFLIFFYQFFENKLSLLIKYKKEFFIFLNALNLKLVQYKKAYSLKINIFWQKLIIYFKLKKVINLRIKKNKLNILKIKKKKVFFFKKSFSNLFFLLFSRKILALSLSFFKYIIFINFWKRIGKNSIFFLKHIINKKIEFSIFFTSSKHFSPALMVLKMFKSLKKRNQKFNRAFYPTLRLLSNSKRVEAFKIICSGRFEKHDRAKYLWRKKGKTGVSRPTDLLDYNFLEKPLKYGASSVKLFIKLIDFSLGRFVDSLFLLFFFNIMRHKMSNNFLFLSKDSYFFLLKPFIKKSEQVSISFSIFNNKLNTLASYLLLFSNFKFYKIFSLSLNLNKFLLYNSKTNLLKKKSNKNFFLNLKNFEKKIFIFRRFVKNLKGVEKKKLDYSFTLHKKKNKLLKNNKIQRNLNEIFFNLGIFSSGFSNKILKHYLIFYQIIGLRLYNIRYLKFIKSFIKNNNINISLNKSQFFKKFSIFFKNLKKKKLKGVILFQSKIDKKKLKNKNKNIKILRNLKRSLSFFWGTKFLKSFFIERIDFVFCRFLRISRKNYVRYFRRRKQSVKDRVKEVGQKIFDYFLESSNLYRIRKRYIVDYYVHKFKPFKRYRHYKGFRPSLFIFNRRLKLTSKDDIGYVAVKQKKQSFIMVKRDLVYSYFDLFQKEYFWMDKVLFIFADYFEKVLNIKLLNKKYIPYYKEFVNRYKLAESLTVDKIRQKFFFTIFYHIYINQDKRKNADKYNMKDIKKDIKLFLNIPTKTLFYEYINDKRMHQSANFLSLYKKKRGIFLKIPTMTGILMKTKADSAGNYDFFFYPNCFFNLKYSFLYIFLNLTDESRKYEYSYLKNLLSTDFQLRKSFQIPDLPDNFNIFNIMRFIERHYTLENQKKFLDEQVVKKKKRIIFRKDRFYCISETQRTHDLINQKILNNLSNIKKRNLRVSLKNNKNAYKKLKEKFKLSKSSLRLFNKLRNQIILNKQLDEKKLNYFQLNLKKIQKEVSEKEFRIILNKEYKRIIRKKIINNGLINFAEFSYKKSSIFKIYSKQLNFFKQRNIPLTQKLSLLDQFLNQLYDTKKALREDSNLEQQKIKKKILKYRKSAYAKIEKINSSFTRIKIASIGRFVTSSGWGGRLTGSIFDQIDLEIQRKWGNAYFAFIFYYKKLFLDFFEVLHFLYHNNKPIINLLYNLSHKVYDFLKIESVSRAPVRFMLRYCQNFIDIYSLTKRILNIVFFKEETIGVEYSLEKYIRVFLSGAKNQFKTISAVEERLKRFYDLEVQDNFFRYFNDLWFLSGQYIGYHRTQSEKVLDLKGEYSPFDIKDELILAENLNNDYILVTQELNIYTKGGKLSYLNTALQAKSAQKLTSDDNQILSRYFFLIKVKQQLEAQKHDQYKRYIKSSFYKNLLANKSGNSEKKSGLIPVLELPLPSSEEQKALKIGDNKDKEKKDLSVALDLKYLLHIYNIGMEQQQKEVLRSRSEVNDLWKNFFKHVEGEKGKSFKELFILSSSFEKTADFQRAFLQIINSEEFKSFYSNHLDQKYKISSFIISSRNKDIDIDLKKRTITIVPGTQVKNKKTKRKITGKNSKVLIKTNFRFKNKDIFKRK